MPLGHLPGLPIERLEPTPPRKTTHRRHVRLKTGQGWCPSRMVAKESETFGEPEVCPLIRRYSTQTLLRLLELGASDILAVAAPS